MLRVPVSRTSRLGVRQRRRSREREIVLAARALFDERGTQDASIDDIARAVGLNKAIIYRHFASKTELYQAVLDQTQAQLREHVGPPEQYDENSVRALVRAACDNPDGFRLLFVHAQREPDFATMAEERNRVAAEITESYLRERLPDAAHRRWIASLIPKLTIELILSWLDAGRPTGPDELVKTIRATSQALVGDPQTG
jgi:AcrR family transcriptional regulator